MVKPMARRMGRLFREALRNESGGGVVETIVTVAAFVAIGLYVYSKVSNTLNNRTDTITTQINSISSGTYTGP